MLLPALALCVAHTVWHTLYPVRRTVHWCAARRAVFKLLFMGSSGFTDFGKSFFVCYHRSLLLIGAIVVCSAFALVAVLLRLLPQTDR